MNRLQVSEIVFDRNEDGKLLPVEVELELLRIEGQEPKTVLITPMPRGELKKLGIGSTGKTETSPIDDEKIILAHLIEPKLTEAEIKLSKPKEVGAIVTAILAISLNISQTKIQDASKIAIQKKIKSIETDLKKK